VVATVSGAGERRVLTADVGVRPAGGYSGAGYSWATDDELVVATAGGPLVVLGVEGGPPRRTLSRTGRTFAPAVSDAGLVAFCCEIEDSCDVAVVPLDGSAWPVRASHADYAWDPAWAPGGGSLAWHEWDLPDMPWDASRIVLAAVDGSTVCAGRTIAGGDDSGEEIACGQPRFAPGGGALGYTTDRDGWMRLWIARPDGSRPRPALEDESEHAEPSWGPGQRSWAWSPAGDEVVLCRNEQGFGRLVRLRPGARARAREVAKAWHRGIDWGTPGIAAIRAGARTPDQLVVQEPDGERAVVARGPVAGFEAAGLVEPEAVTWRTGRASVHGLLYMPESSALDGPPPLLVIVHGGPTGQGLAEWYPRIPYWTSRGWAVLRPNHRGSTGYGRAYAQALAGRWGDIDIADVAAGIRWVAQSGRVDGDRIAVMGGSAGGMATLLVCARHPDLVRAGVSLCGVTDLYDLAATTHRFESRYLDRIVGVLPGDADRYRDRSPNTHADDVQVPLLVLQGADDEVVPRAQADALVERARRAGAEVEYHVYDGEGHGFRRIETIVDELARTEAFLSKWVLHR
jgi:dipeptidyl aminopeptidase/acylaminoacyl peptidase